MKLLHPTRRRIERWMRDPGPGRLEQHLSTCDRCSRTLEAETEQPLRELLNRLLAPPASFVSLDRLRLRERATRFAPGALLQKLAAWLETGKVPPDPEDGPSD
jgi:hypothetical protein